MNRQIIFLSPELMELFGAPVNIVASIICLLSKDGQQQVTATEQFLADRSFLSTRLVSKAKRILKEHGYINIATSSIGFKRFSVITATAKLIQAFSIPDETSEAAHKEIVTDYAQNATSIPNTTPTQHTERNRDRTECLDHTHSVRVEIAQYAASDYAQCADKNNNKRIIENNKENNKENNISARENFDDDFSPMSENDVHEFLSIPLAADYDFPDQENEKNSDFDFDPEFVPEFGPEFEKHFAGMSEPTPLKSKTPQAEEKKNSAKRKERKPRAVIEYPKNAAEVLKLMQAWKEKHVSVEPRIQGVNIALESEKFFEYWSERNWTNKRGKIKSMNSTVATWLGFAIDKVKGNYTAPAPVPAPENDRPKISVFDAVERGLCKNLDEASALANADGWIFEDQLKNVVDAEFEIVEDEPLALER